MARRPLRTHSRFFERAVNQGYKKRKAEFGAPPPWYGYLSPATGLAALIVSVLSAGLSFKAYKINKGNRDDTTAPKLAIVEVGLTHPRNSDIPVLSYQVRNYGTLATDDIHTWLQYRYAAPLDMSRPLPQTGTNNETIGPGARLVPGDHLDRTNPIFTYFVPTTTGGAEGSWTVAQDVPSYQKLRDGLAYLQIELSTQANDAGGNRIVLCDAFEYQAITDKFERGGSCLRIDIVNGFRSQEPPKEMRVDPTTMTLVPKK